MKRWLDTLRAEMERPLSHGNPIDGSRIRLAIVVAIIGYIGVALGAGLVGPHAVPAARRVLEVYAPILLLGAGVHYAYMRWRPDDRSVARLLAITVFDSVTCIVGAVADQVFLPILALAPWIAIVYGIRFGPAWLTTSAAFSVAGFGYLFATADEGGLRSFHLTFILATVLVTFYCRRLLVRMKHDQDLLQRLATCDPLTGLPNRRALHDRLVQAIALAPRVKRDIAVLYFDLDGFKRVNDQSGHATGDALLCDVANGLGYRLRQTDTLARIAGDEFVIVLQDVAIPEGARTVGEAVISVIEGIAMVGGQRVQVSASVGIAVWRHQLGVPSSPDQAFDRLISAADGAMYEAKQAGKGRCRFAQGELGL